MEAAPTRARRVELGFTGGGAISLRLQEDEYRTLRTALEGSHERRWHEIQSEESSVVVDLEHVVFIRLDIERERTGF